MSYYIWCENNGEKKQANKKQRKKSKWKKNRKPIIIIKLQIYKLLRIVR